MTAVQGLLLGVILLGIVLLSLQRSAGGGSSGIGWAVLSMLSLGAAIAMWKPLTEAGGPILAVLSVRVLASLVVLGYLRVRRAPVSWPAPGRGRRLLFSAAFLDVAGYVAYNIGLTSAPLTVIAPLGAAHPVATIALALVLLRERPT